MASVTTTSKQQALLESADNYRQEVNSKATPKEEVTTYMKEVAQPISQQSDFDYYTSERFLKRASVSIVPIGLIGAYCYHKKFSLTKSALLVSIPIVIITGLQYVFMGGGKNKYWEIFTPPSARNQYIKQVKPVQK